MKAGRVACRPIEGEEIPTKRGFSVKKRRIWATFIYSTTNGYRQLMKTGRAACRPIEEEEIIRIETFRFKN